LEGKTRYVTSEKQIPTNPIPVIFFYTQTIIIIIQTERHDVGLRKEPNGENMKLCKQGDEFHLDEHYGLRK
jgi:hypothetical protein